MSNSVMIAFFAGLAILLLSLLLIVTLPFPSFLKIPERKAELVDMDGIQYYVVFKQNDTFYLDEAEIDGDVLIVNADKQRYLVSNDVSIEIRHFSKIMKIKQKDSSSLWNEIIQKMIHNESMPNK